MDIGRLDKRITFYKKNDVRDVYNRTTTELIPYVEVWASVEPINSKEVIQAGRNFGEVSCRVYVRYREDITTNMFVRYNGRKFEIVAPPIDTQMNHEILTILCKESEGENF